MVHQMAVTCVDRAGQGEPTQESESTPSLAPDGGDGSLAVTAAATGLGLHYLSLFFIGHHHGVGSPWMICRLISLQRLNSRLEIFILHICVVPVLLTYKN